MPLVLVGQSLVVTVTEEPVVLTEIPAGRATAVGAVRAIGSAAAATDRPERRSS